MAETLSVLLSPEPSWYMEDLEQEFALRKLEGAKYVSRKIILQNLMDGDLILFDDTLEDAGEAFSPRPLPSFETLEALIGWARGQGKEVQDLVDWFLDEPEDRLEDTLERLVELGLVPRKYKNKALKDPRDNFTDLLRREFQKEGTLDWDHLSTLASREHKNKANLRGTLGVLMTKNEITHLGKGTYQWIK
jgi:hypothetical protein